MIQLVKDDKIYLKPLRKGEKKIIKCMKHDYRVARKVYVSTYTNMAELFKNYPNSLPPDEINKTEMIFEQI